MTHTERNIVDDPKMTACRKDYNDGVHWMKKWIGDRMTWLDENTPQSGVVVTGINKAGLVTVDVFDVTGRKLIDTERNHDQSGKFQMNWPASSLPPGAYVVRAFSGNEIIHEKIIKRP